MAKKAACKCKATECEECPEWIFTFADLVMLMMGFFVILWVLKPSAGANGAAKEAAEQQPQLPVDVLAAIRDAFGYVPDAKRNDPVDQKMIIDRLQHPKRMKGPGQASPSRMEVKGAEGTDPEVTTIRPGRVYTTGSALGFEAGSAAVSPELKVSLDQLAEQIKGHRNIVLVKGHTALDDLPESAGAGKRMELSVRRAQAVADYLVSKGVEAEVLRVQGCSTFEPVVQREYEVNAQARNRRVEVEGTGTLVQERQDARRQERGSGAGKGE